MSSSAPSPGSAVSDEDSYQVVLQKPTHMRILVSDSDAGRIIGKAGSSINDMDARSGAHIKVSGRGRHLVGTHYRVAFVTGLLSNVLTAAELILKKILSQGDQVSNVVLVVPHACCSALIGEGGKVIRMLADTSSAGIKVSPYNICYGFEDRLVTITGHLDNLLAAMFMILSELLDNVHYTCSYSSLSFPNDPCSSVGYDSNEQDGHVKRYHNRPDTSVRSSDNSSYMHKINISVAEKHVGAIIGCAGRTIQEIERLTNVRIRISGKWELIPGTNCRKVVISGAPEAVDAAVAMIEQRVSAAAKTSRGQQGGGDTRPVKHVGQQQQ